MRAVSKSPRTAAWQAKATGALPKTAGALVGLLFLSPLAYLAIEATRAGSLSSIAEAQAIRPLLRSLLLATAVATITVLVGTALAWLATRSDIPGRRILAVAAALPLAIPSFVAAAALRAALGVGGLIPWLPRPSGFWGALVVLVVVTYPYVYLPVAAALVTTPPDVEDAARLLGDTPYRMVRSVIVPQIRPATVSGALIVFLYVLSDFGAVSLMRYDTLTRQIYSSRLADTDTALALGLLLGGLALAAATVERRLSRSRAPYNSARKPRSYQLGRTRWPVFAVVASFLGTVIAAPAVVFLVWWLRSSLAAGSTYPSLAESLAALVTPGLNTVVAACVAGLSAAVLLLPAAYLAAGRESRVGFFASTAIASAFAVPGLVLALAVVYWVVQAPAVVASLYQTFPLLILVYVLHFGVQSHRTSVAAIAGLPRKYREAARMLGAGRFRRFATVDVPLIGPGVLAGGGLVLLSVVKELPATLLLAPTGFDTLATRVWNAAEGGFLGDVGVTSLGLLLLSGTLTWVLVLRPMQRNISPAD